MATFFDNRCHAYLLALNTYAGHLSRELLCRLVLHLHEYSLNNLALANLGTYKTDKKRKFRPKVSFLDPAASFKASTTSKMGS